jgi:RNA polymerase sigma-70 factor, ECF subfamily
MNQRRYLERLGEAVHANRARLVGIAIREGLTGEDALDVVQRAFESVLEADDPDGILSSPVTARRHLSAVTRNLARNHRRLHAVARPHLSDEGTLENLPDEGARDPESTVVEFETLLKLGGCLRTLAATQRAVVRLRLLEERAGDDVARELRLTAGHVAVLLHRATANLRICMQKPASATSP